MNTAELLVSCLENEGVEYIFGLPGEENLQLLQALKRSSIQFITTRHEQGAAFMADVYGRLTGKAGVCLSTLGPGATNLMTGVADANLDRAPLVAITGQVGTDRMHIESHQYLDLVAMFEPVTKWNKQILRPDNTPEIVRKAFRLAQNEPLGAVHIDLPENIAAMEASGAPLRVVQPPHPVASEENLQKAAIAISQANKPIILVGNGAIRNLASESITRFAQQMNIPVTNTFMGKGVLDYRDERSLWTVGLQQRDYIACALDASDLVIAIGYDLIEYSPTKWNPQGHLPIVHISVTPAEINGCYIPSVEIVGDISDALTEIGKRLQHSQPIILSRSKEDKLEARFSNLRAEMQENYEQYANDAGFPIKPQKLLYDLRQVLDPEDIVISDVGAHKMWIARHYHCARPNTCLISNGFASMGIAIPGGVAAKLVHPNRNVVAVTGDGGFMMNCQELETAHRISAAFVTIIFNDGGYGLIEWKQESQYQEASYIKFNNPDFVKLAESMNIKGYRIKSAEDFMPVLTEALAQTVPSIIDCPIDYRENLLFSEQAKALHCPLPQN
ncbi:Thiamine pyrophosphate enzyme, central domain family [Synechococcus sp. PCC 7335]|uniref:acetolactate synthase large subunit n=1 Tax=Synechococcus sp. (strain ATCC 29403 / PCC 7335) TaxID=91464 RepID=UPI00017EDD60|nr:acetolactate synthase large subunit [Synechococcus sp. PCC 7335]EDX83432.1 Thiamine pyrophosphate enzyme, central domain family [Synechococcus sp. PCC 7335]